MQQETVPEQVTVPPTPTPTPNKAKQRETTYAGKLGDWQRILATLAANASDLPHLEIPRAQLAAFLTQAVEIKQQQAASRAAKETASVRLQTAIVDGQRLAALLRQAVRQHYGPRSPKLAEFNLKVFRGRTPNPASTPEPPPPPPAAPATPTPGHHLLQGPPPPPPAVELTTTPVDTVSKAPSAPTHLA